MGVKDSGDKDMKEHASELVCSSDEELGTWTSIGELVDLTRTGLVRLA